MRRSVYESEADNEERHWWFVARRELLMRRIDALSLSVDATILDVGTSTGTNLRMLKNSIYQRVVGIELDSFAIGQVVAKTAATMVQGNCLQLPICSESIDLLLATDVLEHIDDDRTAAAELCRVVRDGGRALITVPAFMSLWGPQDDLSFHKRRYKKEDFRILLEAAGFSVERVWYFNAFLFLPIFVARKILRAAKFEGRSEGDINSKTLNYVLLAIFRFDCRLSELMQFPFGVSIAAQCRRN